MINNYTINLFSEFFVRKIDIEKDKVLASFQGNDFCTKMYPSPDGAYVGLQYGQLDLTILRIEDMKA